MYMGKGCLSQHQLGLGVLPSLSMTLAELGLTNNPRILSLNWGHLGWLRTLAIYFVWIFCLNRSALAIPTNFCQICETSTSEIVMHKLFSQGQMPMMWEWLLFSLFQQPLRKDKHQPALCSPKTQGKLSVLSPDDIAPHVGVVTLNFFQCILQRDKGLSCISARELYNQKNQARVSAAAISSALWSPQHMV